MSTAELVKHSDNCHRQAPQRTMYAGQGQSLQIDLRPPTTSSPSSSDVSLASESSKLVARSESSPSIASRSTSKSSLKRTPRAYLSRRVGHAKTTAQALLNTEDLDCHCTGTSHDKTSRKNSSTRENNKIQGSYLQLQEDTLEIMFGIELSDTRYQPQPNKATSGLNHLKIEVLKCISA